MLLIVTLLLLFSYFTNGAYVVSWGNNQFGQLGNGNTNDMLIATEIKEYGNVNIANIRVGLSTHFAMAVDGTVYCSGNNIYGQLGINSVQNQNRPVKNSLALGLDVYPIGPQTIAYNATTKDVYGWGLDAGYMMGGSFTGNQQTPRKSSNSEFQNTVIGISTGWSASFVMLNGGVYSAGKLINYNGYITDSTFKLGTGTSQDQPNFLRMSYWNNNPLLKLFPTSSSHVCGLSKAFSLYCWGRNNFGQVGIGHSNDVSTPNLVSFFDDEGLYVAQIKTGDAHTIALTCGGKVYSWGTNTRGNLGRGFSDSLPHSTPRLIANLTALNIVEITSAKDTVFARNSTNHWHVWGSSSSNITQMSQTSGDLLRPTFNPFFSLAGLTRIATNSKSAFAFAWNDANPPMSRSVDCPALIDECARGMDNCALNTLCVDTERSYKCVCGPGFAGNGISVAAGGTGCNDIDECATDQCLPQATCVNQLGSFYCSCPPGYDGDGKKNGTGCKDIDECAEGGYCNANTVCTNTIGSYTCSCQAGYRQITSTPCGIICTDIDECNTQNPCGPGARCNNTAGSYNCPCLPGYSGTPCKDVNECTTGKHNCASQEYCQNVAGSFQCKCPSGFTGDAVSTATGGSGCLDVNECATTSGACHVNATCANSVGSYKCTCKTGFAGDGRTCADVDECVGANNCVGANGVCTNTLGGYTCGCKVGYTGNGIKTTISGGTGCTDVDECAATNKCASGAKCTNTQGSYTCTCPSGYQGSGFSCFTVTCPVGTYPNSSTTCAPCPAGTYGNVTGVETCTACPAGTYTAATGKTSVASCTACPKNTYSLAGSSGCVACPPGTVSEKSSGTCTPCPAGQYGFQGTCKNCGVGWFSSSPGATDCEPCPPGYAAASNNATSCTICPAGTTSKGRSATCDACPAGRTSSAGQYYCTACPAGTSTQGSTGASSCSVCNPGSSSASGSATCTSCPQGSFAAANGSDACDLCAPGTYQDEGGQTSCKACSGWQYSDTQGATTCSPCYQGYAGEFEFGSKTCLACPPGTFRTNGPIPVCTPCYRGSATELAGQPHCQYCMGGYYAKKCGQKSCDACAPGTYSSFTAVGADTCPYCPYGQESFGTAYFCYW